MRKLFLPLIAALALAAVAFPAAALASPPANDGFASATPISSLPFSDSVDITEATTEPNEPQICDNVLPMTVWYAVTPAADGILHATGPDSTFNGIVNIYRADGPAITDLVGLACNNLVYSTDANVQAGQTYYIQAGSYGDPGTLHLQVWESVAPPNDDFDNATVISSLPFSDTEDTTLATRAPDDTRDPCGSFGDFSVWYAYTPSVDTPFIFDVSGTDYLNEWSIYTGERGALTNIGCGGFGTNQFGFIALAGVTYHIRISGAFSGGTLVFTARQGVTVQSITISPSASVSHASGVATVSGTVTCDQPAMATISGTLRQRLTRFVVIHGSFSVTVPCSAAGSPWTSPVVGDNGPFGSGKAGLDATATACDLVCTSKSTSQTVSLRPSH